MNQQPAACSADDATHFANLNATLGSLAEVTSLAQDPADANQLLAGTERQERQAAAMAPGSCC